MTAELIYPVRAQTAESRCTHCWQPGPSALHADPFGEDLRRLCGPCGARLRTGYTADLTLVQLAGMWEWLAHQHINHLAGEDTGVTEAHIDRALAEHTPAGMPPQAGWARFEALMDDLAAFHRAEDPATVLDCAETGPDHDGETYANDLRGLVDDAVHKLIGRRP